MGKQETQLTLKIYSKNINEWERLVKDPFHKLEFDTTFKFLRKFFPKKGLVLDAGGGPGRYSIELAKKGYDIILLDLVPKLLDIAKKKIKLAKVQSKIKEIIEGDVTDLSYFKNNSFDAVICLGGALSHVHPKRKRKQAVSELIRVAKKGAPIFISVMGKFGTIARFFPKFINQLKDNNHFKKVYLHGDDYRWYNGKKSYAHFFELAELKSLFGNNVKILQQVGLQGVSSFLKEEINKLAITEPKAWGNWLKMHYKLCTNPTVADLSLHFMVIAKKK